MTSQAQIAGCCCGNLGTAVTFGGSWFWDSQAPAGKILDALTETCKEC